MRKGLFPVFCSLVLASLFAARCRAQAAPKLAPELRAFVKEDAPLVALTHVRVIDGTGAAPRADQTLVIREGKIASLGDRASTKIPEGAKVVDLSGRTVIPGLVGMHDHMYYPSPGGPPPLYPEHAASFPRLYLAGGVTSIRTTGSIEPYADLELKRDTDDGKMAGPKIHVTGPYLEGPGAFALQMHQLTDAEDARRTVEFWIAQGVTSFKAYQNITPEELGAAVEAAHAHGMKVTWHLCSIGFREAASLGIDDLEHGLVVDTEFYSAKKPDECADRAARVELARMDVNSPGIQQLIAELVKRRVAIKSTLPVFELFDPSRSTQPRALEAMAPDTRAMYLQNQLPAAHPAAGTADWKKLLQLEMPFERAFVAAGGTLLAGCDPTGNGGVLAGYGDQRGLELLVEAGFTPLEAIRIATLNGAQFLGEAERVGSLAQGKLADMMLVNGDPPKQIADVEKVELV